MYTDASPILPSSDDPAAVLSATGRARTAQMRPVTIDGCFGWLHTASGSGSETAALICPGLGRDASTAHRSFRLLADQLAAAGYPALRFDYPGTGDSCDVDAATHGAATHGAATHGAATLGAATHATEYWAVWRDSVHAAADWLRASTGARRLVLIGLRIGAALAALTAESREDVGGLVLLAPVLKGRSYVSQLTVTARLRGAPPSTIGGLEVDELRLSSATLGLMRQVDLRTTALPPDCKVAVFPQEQSTALSECVRAWSDRGADVGCGSFAELEALLRPSHMADEPAADFSGIMGWLQTTLPIRQIAVPPTLPGPGTTELRPPGCVETSLRFGAQDCLFGILCRPAEETRRDLAVVIGNTGGDPHYGLARFSVELARSLAGAGIASLRLDFAGLGDSVALGDDGEEDLTHVFEVDRGPDIGAALDVLEGLGYRRFAAQGLCSGAYHAYHAAVLDRRISVLLLVNLPWFTLRHERAGPSSFARRSMTELAQGGTKTLLLFGEGDLGLKHLERHFGAEGADLPGPSPATVRVVPGLDHDLTGRAMRRTAADIMLGFLQDALEPAHV